ncbi:MAG: type II toxin-antitoxin system VapC family toxin [Dehalococcoidia bacterium]
MNHALAVDASIAVKWVVAEEFADQALKLWTDSVADDRAIVAPPHFAGEVTNAIYQRLRSTDPARHLDHIEADRALTGFLRYPVEITIPPDMYRRAFEFACDHTLPSVYDSLYVVLAQMLDIELWTADGRLLDAVGQAAPWVRFIGDYPLR